MVSSINEAKQKSLILKMLKGIVFSSLLGLLLFYNLSRPKIMIVHSYDPTLDIVEDFDKGVKKSLENKIGPLVQSYYLNMFSKNTIKQKIEAGVEARASVDRFKPDILIAIGDEAQEFVAKFYLGEKKMKVIFAGVKGDLEKIGYIPEKNVSGIIEMPQLQELNKLINHMFPGKKNIRLAHLGDTSTIVSLTEEMLTQYVWKNVKFQDSVKVLDINNFKKAAQLLDKHCDVLLISSYRGLKSGLDTEEDIISTEAMQWVINNTSIPIVSTFGYAVEEGAGVAIVSSAYEQGTLAMDLALKMLEDDSHHASAISKVFAVYLNDTHLSKCNIQIPLIYRSFAVGTQKLFETAKSEESL